MPTFKVFPNQLKLNKNGFQLLKFVAEYDAGLIREIEKYKYVKILRAQLSNYEQLMLFYNSISDNGKEWNSKGNNFISRYKLIKNIPLPMADFGVIPAVYFKNEIVSYKKKGENFFEWDE